MIKFDVCTVENPIYPDMEMYIKWLENFYNDVFEKQGWVSAMRVFDNLCTTKDRQEPTKEIFMGGWVRYCGKPELKLVLNEGVYTIHLINALDDIVSIVAQHKTNLN